MTTIKFRGFRVDNDKPIYGDLLQINGEFYIYPNEFGDLQDTDFGSSFIEVYISSLGMFTGLHDKNGKEIYGAIGERGGDWVQVTPGYTSYIIFKDAMFVSVYTHPEGGEEIPLIDIIGFKNNIEIIGNQFEQE